jgi:hypothetical protein
MNRVIDFQLQLVRMMAMTPMMLVMLAGVILAIRRLPQQPRSCWALIAALGLSAFNSLGMPVLTQFLMVSLGTFRSTQELWLRTLIFTLPTALVGAVSWGLILFAVFDGRVSLKFLPEHDPDRDLLDK